MQLGSAINKYRISELIWLYRGQPRTAHPAKHPTLHTPCVRSPFLPSTMFSSSPWLVLGLVAAVAAQQGGSIAQAGNTLVSAMMVRLFLRSWFLLFSSRARCSSETRRRYISWTRPKVTLLKSIATLRGVPYGQPSTLFLHASLLIALQGL